MKNKNGITLIALIITIIILLILAMVTINILINQGIIGHAQNAVETYDEKQVKEDIALSYDEYKMQKFGANAKSLYDFFKDKYGADHVTDNGDGSITVSVTSNGKTYTVKLKEDGSMESMSGLSLDKSSITLEYEDGTPATGTITATLTDISGDVKWSIADNTIATISATTGNQITVTSVKSGTTTITATCGKYTKTCEVKVYEKLPIGEYINYKCYSTVADEDKSKLIHTASKEQTGYDIDQEYQVTEDVKWKILGRDDDGHILIITADSMESKTKGYLYSKGKTGYMYLPDELDAISKIYGFGQHAIGARSIKVEDVNTIQEYKPGVQKKYTYMKSADDGYVRRNGYTGSSSTTTCWYCENGDIKGQWKTLKDGETSPEIVSTSVGYTINESNEGQKMIKYKDNGSTRMDCWLATHVVSCGETQPIYYVLCVYYGYVQNSNYGQYMIHSSTGFSGGAHKVRPVVTLDITELAGKDDDGVWQIE